MLGYKLALPCIFLSNVCSLEKKLSLHLTSTLQISSQSFTNVPSKSHAPSPSPPRLIRPYFCHAHASVETINQTLLISSEVRRLFCSSGMFWARWMFREAATYSTNLKEYTSSATVSKTITTQSHQKLWMTAEVWELLKSHDSSFRTGVNAA